MASINFRRVVIWSVFALLLSMARDANAATWGTTSFNFNDGNGSVATGELKDGGIYTADEWPTQIGAVEVFGYILRGPHTNPLYIRSSVNVPHIALSGQDTEIHFQGENMTFTRLELRMINANDYFDTHEGTPSHFTTGDLVIGKDGGSASTGTTTVTAGATLTINKEFIISSGTAANSNIKFNQTGGSVNITGKTTDASFLIGDSTTASNIANYNLSGGSLTSAVVATVGNTSAGNLNITGGEADLTGIILGQNADVSGTLTLSGGGKLTLASIAKGSGTATITLGKGTILSSAAHTWASDLAVSLAGTGENATVFDTTGGNITISTNISGDGGVRKTGTGELIFTTPSTFTGGLTIDEGAVRLTAARNGNNSALCPGGTITINEKGTLIANHNENLGYNSTTSIPHIIINGGTLTMDHNNPNYAISLNKITLNGGQITATGNNSAERDFMLCGEVHVTADATISADISLRDFTGHTSGPKGKAFFNVDAGKTLTVTSPSFIANTGSLPQYTIDKFGQGTMNVASDTTLNEYIHDGIYERSNGTASGAITVKADSTLENAGKTATYRFTGGAINASTIDIGGGADGTMSTFHWTGDGTLTPNTTMTVSKNGEFIARDKVLYIAEGANNTGKLNISGGTVDVSGLFLTEKNTGGTGELTLSDGGTLVIGKDSVQKDTTNAVFKLGTGTVKASANHFWGGALSNVSFTGNTTFDTNGFNIDFRAEAGGAGGITKTGKGTLSLSTNAKTFTGPIVVDEGTLNFQAGTGGWGQINANIDITVNEKGIFDGTKANNQNVNRYYIGNTGSLTVDGGTVIVNGLYINGNGSAKTDSGLTLTNNGTIEIGATGVFRSGENLEIKLGDGTIKATAGHTWGGGVPNVEFTGNTTFDTNGFNIAFRPGENTDSVKAFGTGGITKTGKGDLQFAAQQLWKGDLVVKEGTVTLTSGSAAGGISSICNASDIIIEGGTLKMTVNDTLGWHTGNPNAIYITGGTLETVNAVVSIDSPITFKSGTMSGVSTHWAGSYQIGGEIAVLEEDAGGAHSRINADMITFRAENIYTGGKITTDPNATLEISSIIRGTNVTEINKHGEGTLILSGTSGVDVNLHGGTLQIGAGTLAGKLNGDNANRSVNLTNTGGTLNLVDSDPDKTAIFNLGGNYTQGDSGSLHLEIYKDSVGNYLFDSLNVGGLIELGGTLDILMTGELWTSDDMAALAANPLQIFAGTDPDINGDFSSIFAMEGTTISDLPWYFDPGAGTLGIGLQDNGSAVPEPATWAMMLAGLAGLLWFRRKQV